jgi:hypothetical protein
MPTWSNARRTRTPRLDRHDIDRVARAVASGRRGLGSRLDALADAIAGRMTQKLEAAGVPTARSRCASEVAIDRATRDVIISRVSKHLPVVHGAPTDGSPHPR